MTRPIKFSLMAFAMLGIAVFGAYVHQRLHGLPVPPTPPSIGATPVTASPGPTVPMRRPSLTLNDLDGKAHGLSEWDGHILLVNFWATWCAPCRREIPLLNRISTEFAAKNVKIVGIAVDFADDVKTYVQQNPVSYPLLVGEQEGLDAAKAFGVASMAFPFTALMDAKGDVLAVHLGELHEASLREVLAITEQVDQGQLSLESARTRIDAAFKAASQH